MSIFKGIIILQDIFPSRAHVGVAAATLALFSLVISSLLLCDMIQTIVKQKRRHRSFLLGKTNGDIPMNDAEARRAARKRIMQYVLLALLIVWVLLSIAAVIGAAYYLRLHTAAPPSTIRGSSTKNAVNAMGSSGTTATTSQAVSDRVQRSVDQASSFLSFKISNQTQYYRPAPDQLPIPLHLMPQTQ
ncbi:hypothetical protein NEHOM01_2238 [Nematocida homosporus]|uniref:uncharacterized protein n=1 Tax=Nematocida homosporus TaxID=1912981 RepID=UPI00222081BA|nr:uncharacterized protein NEHOM01_2238 [Nematocida homosporus]KAI5187517.1 hypothetical protein NEHOM01_2238 [Nematocida homosporus]